MCVVLLASNSPRRRKLLTAAGFAFETIPPNAVEQTNSNLTLYELTACNAVRKGLSVARARPQDLVLAADTLVALDGKIIGKPRDLDHAATILRKLSGCTHEVCSSVAIYDFSHARSTMFHEVSRVRFHRLSKGQIDRYLRKVNPLDKAGAYAAQGEGREIIAQIEGSYTNVVGLPMEKTTAALAAFGIKPNLV